jgi:hypothetical protein
MSSASSGQVEVDDDDSIISEAYNIYDSDADKDELDPEEEEENDGEEHERICRMIARMKNQSTQQKQNGEARRFGGGGGGGGRGGQEVRSSSSEPKPNPVGSVGSSSVRSPPDELE